MPCLDNKKDDPILYFGLRIVFLLPLLLICVKRQYSDYSCSLDSLGNGSLVHCACASDSSREDLSSLCDVFLKSLCILVVDLLVLISTELADFTSSDACVHALRS